MSLEQRFQKAAGAFKATLVPPTEAEYAQCYALFKQGTVGDVNTPDPGVSDWQGKKKWNAWNSKKGMSMDAAKEEYIKIVTEVLKKEDDSDG